ncbi:MAG: hypothetical protein ACR2G5_03985 [Pyrinomonadaceae bacterium]
MKHCPKCSRTFPDESQKFCTVDGGVLIGEPTVDPNATIRVNPADLEMLMPQERRDKVPKSAKPPEIKKAPEVQKPPDTGATLFAPAGSPPTSVAPPPPTKNPPSSTPAVSPSGVERASPPAARGPAMPSASAPVSQVKKKSWLPWILGALLLFLLLGLGVVAALIYILKPRVDEFLQRSAVTRQDSTGTTANNNPAAQNNNAAINDAANDVFVPPASAAKFTNSKDRLDGKLATHYIDFSFYYPKSWETDANAGVTGSNNFVKVERRLPPDFTQENFAVGWYTSGGSFATDEPTFPQLVETFGSGLSKSFPEYRKVSEGPTTVNSLPGYEFLFISSSKGTEKGDIDIWGRVIFLPTGVKGKAAGATLSMLATSLAPELSGVEDVGEKGEMPLILESFRFNNN